MYNVSSRKMNRTVAVFELKSNFALIITFILKYFGLTFKDTWITRLINWYFSSWLCKGGQWVQSILFWKKCLLINPSLSLWRAMCVQRQSGIVKNCHLKSQILPNSATKIEKFATFCQKNYQILQIKLNNRIIVFVPWDPEYNIDPKMHTKSHSGAYQKEDQNKSTKTCKDWKRGIKI